MKTVFWAALASGPVALVLWLLAALSPGTVEAVYSRAVYPALMGPWSRLTGLVPGALAPWLLAAFAVAIAVCFFVWKVPQAAAVVGAALSFVFAWFVFGWGLNYQRQSWAQNHGWTAAGGSVAELEALAARLAERAGALRPQVPANQEWSSRAVARAVTAAYERASKTDPLLAGIWGSPKRFPVSDVLSWLGIGGIFIPFTGEPLVNGGPDDWQLPFTMAHEAAHLRGWAREDEANFLAFWVLRDDTDPALAYSAWSSALLYAARALGATPAGAEAWKRVVSHLPPEVSEDWRRSFAYWDRFQGPVSAAAGAVNDVYLKSQGQSDGVRSYGRMVDLLLAAKF